MTRNEGVVDLMVANNTKYAALDIFATYGLLYYLLSRRYSGSVSFACGQVSTVSANKVTQHSRHLADISVLALLSDRTNCGMSSVSSPDSLYLKTDCSAYIYLDFIHPYLSICQRFIMHSPS